MAPSLMILETQTPWCHPLLYKDGLPKSMQGQSHYKNTTSLPWAPYDFKQYSQSQKRLTRLMCPLPGQNTRQCSRHLPRHRPPRQRPHLLPGAHHRHRNLAHTHSLVLYQAIRLFDGDIQARASAERIIPEVEESAMRLLAHVRFDLEFPAGELPLYPLAPTKNFWADWILQESARRTVLFCFFFLQAYRLVAGQKGLECDGRLGLCLSWTLSAHLWNAGTPVQFARAWRDKRHFVVTDAQFGEVLSEAEAGDVDRFGRMWISSLLGTEGGGGVVC
ncbi:hypothetical protein J3458_019710 [Metarhizium acridum]|uniref:C6 finger domain protein, putative n=1 Tax=Metarhizium acridum (strain CQMa 102) TaxID=655827 RepID=E9E4V7_METAQ|nr:C6 finger domain protein, putative [Metarhizium acridum CQMa 102]EFY89130.1 C6 finger domain protein, putative [Metarhizium acridum CQMa 102]KAG8408689.1 hypothetical protein J3458_019710 [Metarhizium acridum]